MFLTVDAPHLAALVARLASRSTGGKFLQAVVDELAEELGAHLAFIARALDYPPSRVEVVAASREVDPAFDLRDTPCELVYAGRTITIERGVSAQYKAAHHLGCEAFLGFPFLDGDSRCVGHLGLFFSEAREFPAATVEVLREIALRLETELLRLDLTNQLEKSRQRLDFQNRILKMAASHVALDQILEHLILGIEAQNPEMHCSIMRPDATGRRLNLFVGPSLAPEYALSLHNIPIAEGMGTCGSAAYLGKRVVAADIGAHPFWPRKAADLAMRHGLRSSWSQPIISAAGELLGVFAIYRGSCGEPGAVEIELIESVTALSSIVMENYQTLDELQLRTLKYQHFLQTSPDGMVVMDLEGRFVEISDGFMHQIGAKNRAEVENTRIWDWDAKNDEAACRRRLCELIDHPVIYETRNRRTDGSLWNAEVSAKAFQVNGQTLIWASSRDITERKRMERELTRRATTDDLTGLLNRPTFMNALATEFQRCQRHGRPLTVLMLDVDHFKRINDTYGHQAGDTVLREVAAALKAQLRTGDVVGRIGGEEFAFILPETGTLGGRDAAEKVRQTVEQHCVQIVGKEQHETLSVTCSIGVAVFNGSERDHEELLSLADRALYEAKAAGRNRVRSAVGI